MVRLTILLACLGSSLAASQPVRIEVAATRGKIIPQSKGGGGFERRLRFTVAPGKAGGWIRQQLAVRGTVFDATGRTKAVHLDIVEYFRCKEKGRTRLDNHYSQFFSARGGDLRIQARLTFGALTPRKRGDTILSKGFILRSCVDEHGSNVTMKTRTMPRQVIPAEHGERVVFERHARTLVTTYAYGVRWDTRRSRTKPVGSVDVGTWRIEPEKSADAGKTRAAVRARPIPLLRRRS